MVVEINPWKFSDNKVTFLQSFLLDLINSSEMKNKAKNELRDEILMTKTQNKLELKKGKWWLIIIAIAILFSVAQNLFSQYSEKFPSWLISVIQFSGTIAIIPWLMKHFEQVASSTVTDKTTSSLINFDKMLTKIVKTYSKDNKEIIIYVDDLDRISAKSAVFVLDNLRTFFDRKELCFVVSGDHSVIERHIGSELLPTGKPEEQLEEGRKYLKKIFDIYWRLPIPTDAEIGKYISETIESKLQGFEFTITEINQLSSLLNNLFENNYRNIERMASQIAFSMQIVQDKLNSCNKDDETRIYYEDLLRHKMLLVKVLLIQELSNPYYEYLLSVSDSLRLSDKEQQIYLDKDHIFENKDSATLKLTNKQYENLFSLIKSEPKFHSDNGLVVYDMKPFIYLSADSNFGDHRGLLPSEFHTRLVTSLSEEGELINLLDQHSVEMLNKGIEAMRAEREAKMQESDTQPQSAPTEEMTQELITLINQLNELSNEYKPQQTEFQAYFVPDDISKYVSLDSNEYAEIVYGLGELYDNDTSYINAFVTCAEQIKPQQFLVLTEYVSEMSTINPLYESVLWAYFEKNSTQSFESFITSIGNIIDKLHDHLLPNNILDMLLNTIPSNSKDAGQNAAKVIMKSGDSEYINNAIANAKALLNKMNPTLVTVLKTLDIENYSDYVLTFIGESNNYQELFQRMNFAISGGLNENEIWKYVIENNADIIITNMSTLINNPQPPNPNSENAKLLAQKVIRYAKDNSQNSLLTRIIDSSFFFKNLESVKGDSVATRHLGNLKKSGDETNINNAKRLLSLDEEVK